MTILAVVGEHIIDLYLHRQNLGFFRTRELNAIEGVAVFDDLERFDDAFVFQVLKESDHDFTSAAFDLVVSVFDTELFKNVSESNGRS